MTDQSGTPSPPSDPSAPPTERTGAGVVAPNPTGGPFCANCGYSLKGLAVDGNCPECGTPIVRSVGGDARSNSPAVTSLVLGIVGLVLGCSSYGLIGLICGPLAIYFHSKAVANVRNGLAPASSLGMAKAGRVCGWVALGIAAFIIVMVALMILMGVALPLIGAAASKGSGGGIGP
jgi:hypothetical protein